MGVGSTLVGTRLRISGHDVLSGVEFSTTLQARESPLMMMTVIGGMMMMTKKL